jgi:antitoxin HicB
VPKLVDCGRMPQKTYTVSDGDMVLTLEPLPKEEGGGYGVTSPLEPQLVTEARTMEEAFEMARDAIAGLLESRRRYAERIAEMALREV